MVYGHVDTHKRVNVHRHENEKYLCMSMELHGRRHGSKKSRPIGREKITKAIMDKNK